MSIQIQTEQTPNPHAVKFLLDNKVILQGSKTFQSAVESENVPLVKSLFDASPNITEAFLNDNYITITQDGEADWNELSKTIVSSIQNNYEGHDPDIAADEETQEESPELVKINDIINEHIRPALQMHGGDVQVLHYANKKLSISYQGACGSCPSAAMGTLHAIKGVLHEYYDPEIEVELG